MCPNYSDGMASSIEQSDLALHPLLRPVKMSEITMNGHNPPPHINNPELHFSLTELVI